MGLAVPPEHVDHFKPEAGDPEHKPGEGPLVGQLGAKGCCVRVDRDLAVVGFFVSFTFIGGVWIAHST